MNYILKYILITGGILFFSLIIISILYYYIDSIYFQIASPKDKPFKWIPFHKWLALRIANIPFPKRKKRAPKNKITTTTKKGGKK